ncbi:patatin-like phospholipase family protein [Paenibacillus sp. B1-33]|uniref:patatin-like phospholipase family protein n=1 Tax=unclassified Paenibacillus TaxID=185978 RepID=UPI003D2E060F
MLVPKEVDAVFEGGGVRGIAFVGAIETMEAQGCVWQRIAGCSAGSIVAALLASGYSGSEIKALMKSLDYQQLLGRTWLNEVPLLSRALPLLLRSGMYVNEPLERTLEKWLAQKGVCTFGDLPRGKLTIIASNVSNGKMVVLPDDLPDYGLTPAEFPIARAVRMSTTLPFFFQPYRWRTPLGCRPYWILDGGLLSNYPIWLFDAPTVPRWPTFGFRLTEKRTYDPVRRIRGPISLFDAMFKTMLQAHDQRHVDKHSESRTIFIPTHKVVTTKFDLTEYDQAWLMESGQRAAQSFLASWNFEKYKREFRAQESDVNKVPLTQEEDRHVYH